LPDQRFDAVVLGVAHRDFLDIDFCKLQNANSLLYDVKGVLGDVADGKL
ncbi:MAG: nucleotide sugar dehydrogenase, partial [Flavobacterium sp.]|nr:nucleotide sugar dehydrogenase [Flavobacterium sp.]